MGNEVGRKIRGDRGEQPRWHKPVVESVVRSRNLREIERPIVLYSV
jgi:hypothetical protein